MGGRQNVVTYSGKLKHPLHMGQIAPADAAVNRSVHVLLKAIDYRRLIACGCSEQPVATSFMLYLKLYSR